MKYSLPHIDLTSSFDPVTGYLKDSRLIVGRAFESGVSGLELNKLVSSQYDHLLKSLFEHFITPSTLGVSGRTDISLSVIALGGYGREEMAPYSDIDFLILCTKEGHYKAEAVIKNIMYPLWNAGVEITGVTRTVEECQKVAKQDIKSLTSMLDARRVAGSQELFHILQNKIQVFFSKSSNKNTFIKKKYDEYKKRLAKYGDSVFVSEPQIKEGEGGLRCFHTAYWFAKVQFNATTPEDFFKKNLVDKKGYEEWSNALDFLWRVRHGLHLNAKRRQDRLDYHLQEVLADKLGYSKHGVLEGLEAFMQNYYKQASFIFFASESLIGTTLDQGLLKRIKSRITSKKLAKNIYRKGDYIFVKTSDLSHFPELVFKAWFFSHQMKLGLSFGTRQRIRSATHFWKVPLYENSEVVDIFKQMIKDPVQLGKVLTEMLETGVLSNLIPEFAGLYHRVQYDAYHHYTVDTHTIFAIREISRLAMGLYNKKFPIYRHIFKEIKKIDILVMAVLLHDIGKGSKSDELHQYSGAKIAKTVMTRLNFDDHSTQVVEFLVRSHLILTQLAFGRDIEDPQMINNFAHSIKTADNMRLLLLLTFADIRAAGPEIWSSWKGELLINLYNKVNSFLSGLGFTEKDLEKEIGFKKRQMAKYIKGERYNQFEKWLETMPMRYALNLASGAIVTHYECLKDLSPAAVEIEVQSSADGDYNNVTVLTHDAPGLFSKICAVFTLNNISILEAQLYTGNNGDVVDLFKVNKSTGHKLDESFNWKKLENDLNEMQREDGDRSKRETLMEEVINSHKAHTKVRRKNYSSTNSVSIDNDVSAYYTVIEILAADRMGLLYKIADWFYQNNYDIFMAKATTHVGQAMDIFYIKDNAGNKVQAKSAVTQIKDALTKCLTG